MLQQIKSNFQPFTIGQKVWLEARNLKTIYNKKIAPKREGPFQIMNILLPLTYSLQLPPMWHIHNAFHAFLLTPYIIRKFKSTPTPKTSLSIQILTIEPPKLASTPTFPHRVPSIPSFWNETTPCWRINGTDAKLMTLLTSSTWCWTILFDCLLPKWSIFCSFFFLDEFLGKIASDGGPIDKTHPLFYLHHLFTWTILFGQKLAIIGMKTLPIIFGMQLLWMTGMPTSPYQMDGYRLDGLIFLLPQLYWHHKSDDRPNIAK